MTDIYDITYRDSDIHHENSKTKLRLVSESRNEMTNVV